MKKLLLALAFLALAPSAALAQCNGVFPNGTLCGNVSGASNLPRAVPAVTFVNTNNIDNYGAVAGANPANAPTNTTAILAAWAASGDITCTGGKTYYINTVTVPTTAASLIGDCTFIPGPNSTQVTGAFNIVNNTRFILSGPQILARVVILSTTGTTNGTTTISSLGSTTGLASGMIVSGIGLPTGTSIVSIGSGSVVLSQAAVGSHTETIIFTQPFDAVSYTTSSNVIITKTILSGRYCVIGSNSSDIDINGNTCIAYDLNGIENITTTGSVQNISARGNIIFGSGLSTSQAIQLSGGTNIAIDNNQIYDCPQHGTMIDGNFVPVINFSMANNVMYGCSHEGLFVISNVSNGVVNGNSIFFEGNADDNGVSIDSSLGFTLSDVVVSNNIISNPGAAGIFVGEIGGGGSQTVRVSIINNRILNPYSTQTDTFESGVLVIGGGTQYITVANNDFLNATGIMQYRVREIASTDGNPSHNTFGPNNGTMGTSGDALVIATTSTLYNSVAAGTGASTSYLNLTDLAGLQPFTAGGAGSAPDPTNYSRNANHKFTNQANTATFAYLDSKSHLGFTSANTTTVSSCGTSPSAVRGTDTAGEVTEGSSATGCTVLFPGSAYTSAPFCTVTPQAALTNFAYFITNAGIIISHSSASATKISWNCFGN